MFGCFGVVACVMHIAVDRARSSLRNHILTRSMSWSCSTTDDYAAAADVATNPRESSSPQVASDHLWYYIQHLMVSRRSKSQQMDDNGRGNQ